MSDSESSSRERAVDDDAGTIARSVVAVDDEEVVVVSDGASGTRSAPGTRETSRGGARDEGTHRTRSTSPGSRPGSSVTDSVAFSWLAMTWTSETSEDVRASAERAEPPLQSRDAGDFQRKCRVLRRPKSAKREALGEMEEENSAGGGSLRGRAAGVGDVVLR